ncbi:glycosyltransferase family 2 protein [Trichodelitschia bisporula]|uniref:Glycosyltransferase family 2 protein n=1 Tax=Trichodelitschia bisporula TaxID=703511 RepID=A0A6G1IAL6_9PEZI|nr:glycosyltransferase family 2 protein [Trichodelitschia bisporula]
MFWLTQTQRSAQDLRALIPNGNYNASSINLDQGWGQDCSILQLDERDDHAHMAPWKRRIYYTVPFLAIASIGTYWAYFVLRILFVISAQRKNGQSFPMAWVFIGVEVAVAIPIMLHSFWTLFGIKKRNRPQFRLQGEDLPTVDVLITCCKEEVDLIVDTTRAACEVDYPQDRFRVVVLDDGGDDVLRLALQALQKEYPNLVYRSREKIPGVPHHFKAGNLNYGLDEVHSMAGGASQFVAALDADMIPEPHWLRAILPHLLIDEKMALACPPQLFYNVPPGDPLAQSLDFFVHVSEPVKDALGVAWCTGSGYVCRRAALDQIGCFPLGSLAEDVATSTLMLGKGWKTAYIHEPLQFGTVPDSFSSHLKQRTRWAIGTVDTTFKLNFSLWGKDVAKMGFFQRFCGFVYGVSALFNIFLALSVYALPIVLISGKPLIAYANNEQLRWLIRACFIALITNRIFEFVLTLPSGYAVGQRGARAHLWMAPYIANSVFRSFFLPTWLGGKLASFKPTGSLKSDINERDPSTRAPLFRRFFTIVFNYLAWYHIAFVYFTLSAVTLSTCRCIAEQRTTNDRGMCLLTHAFWPPISWIMVISAFWIPISYAINPPDCPPREDLLVREKNGVAHPSEKAKKTGWSGQTAIFELEYTLTSLFTCFVFALAFLY